MTQPLRIRLPDRRGCEAFDFVHDGQRYTATIGRFYDGEIAEVFLDSSKVGSSVQAHAQNSAILVSIALQYGVPLATIRHAITGPIAVALDRIEVRS